MTGGTDPNPKDPLTNPGPLPKAPEQTNAYSLIDPNPGFISPVDTIVPPEVSSLINGWLAANDPFAPKDPALQWAASTQDPSATGF